MQTNQNTVYARYYFKSQHLDYNRRYLKCTWIETIKTLYFYIITSFVGILLTMQVLSSVV